MVEPPKLNRDGTLDCEKAGLWIWEELDHINAANKRLKQIRKSQVHEPYNPLTWW